MFEVGAGVSLGGVEVTVETCSEGLGAAPAVSLPFAVIRRVVLIITGFAVKIAVWNAPAPYGKGTRLLFPPLFFATIGIQIKREAKERQRLLQFHGTA